MKLSILFAVLCFATGLSHANGRLTYAEAVALAKERSQPTGSAHDLYVIGPWSTEEITEVDGKEVKRRIPVCMTTRSDELGLILRQRLAGTDQKLIYQVEVVRQGSEKPVVKLIGKFEEIQFSQYPIKKDDVIFITRKEGK